MTESTTKMRRLIGGSGFRSAMSVALWARSHGHAPPTFGVGVNVAYCPIICPKRCIPGTVCEMREFGFQRKYYLKKEK